MRARIATLVACLLTIATTAALLVVATPPSGAVSAPLAEVNVVTGGDGAATLRFTPPLSTRMTATRVINPGLGRKPSRGQRVSYDFTLVDARDGRVLQTTSGKHPTSTIAARNLTDPIGRTVARSRAGSTTVLAIAPLEGVAKRMAPLGAAPDDTLLALVQVRTLHPKLTRATGTEVAPVAGLPAVRTDAKLRPLLGASPDAPPSGPVVEPLIAGTGPTVAPGQNVELQYTGFRWTNGQIVETTWVRGAPVDVTLGSSQTLPAFDGLVGQPVGSRVLLVVPPAEGYGSDGDARLGVSGTETLVYVVDVLDAY